MDKAKRRLLFDVTGLFQWYGFFSQPSGIQRVTERLLNSQPIRGFLGLICVARPLGSSTFFQVDTSDALGLCDPDTRPAAIAKARAYLVQGARLSSLRGMVSDARYFHLPYLAAGLLGAEFLVQAYFLGSIPDTRLRLLPLDRTMEDDAFFIPGDYWCHRTYARTVRQLKRTSRMRLGLLVHDLFAVERPDWSNPAFGPEMRKQFELIAPEVDRWFATSEYVKQSLAAFLPSCGQTNNTAAVLPMGAERIGGSAALDPVAREKVLKRLGIQTPYILHVGTVEPRKNLDSLIDALRGLRAKGLPNVPLCVLAGKDGWQSESFKHRLEATNFEAGSIVWLKSPSDVELGALYDGALFTVVPSFAEGWGLPITESLAHGVPFISTNRGGTVEASKGMGLQFDPAIPDSLEGALKTWLGDPGALEEARLTIQRGFRRSGWNDMGQALLDGMIK